MAKDNGGVIGVLNTPTTSLASGVWMLMSEYQARVSGTWPAPFNLGSSSARFNSGSSDSLSRTPASAGNRQKFTVSLWTKRSAISGSASYRLFASGSDGTECYFGNDALVWYYYSGSYIGQYKYQNTALFRDPSAWYHIVIAVDTTQATATNRFKMYVNGVEGSYAQTTIPQNTSTDWNNTVAHYIGRYSASASYFYDGYMSEIYNIDGQQLDATSFGQTDTTTGIWIPKAYTGTYGTNGFYLNFSNSASLGTDSSGNGNNFTVNNLTSVDQSKDHPTNNFCTANPLNNGMGGTFTEGNLVVTNASATDKAFGATIGMTSGKWYWEVKPTTLGDRNGIGILDISYNTFSATASSNYAFVFVGNGSSGTSGSITGTVPSFSANDIISFAFDADNGKLYFSKNSNLNTSTATYFTITASTYTAGVRETGATVGTNSFNFGAPQYTVSGGYSDANGYGNFSYQPPSGYFALCTNNLASNG
jgi:hypothetical protein